MARIKHGMPGIYNSTAITLDNEEGAALALDSSGRLITSSGGALGYAIDDSAMPATPSMFPVGGEYRASATTYTDGDATVLQSDVNGNLRATLNTLIAGEDLTNDVLKTEQRFSSANIVSATTTTVKSGAGFVHAITFNKFVASEIYTVYDNTAGSGTKIGTLTAPATLLHNHFVWLLDVAFSTGLTIVSGQASDATIAYR